MFVPVRARGATEEAGGATAEQARVWFNQALEYADAPEEMKNAIKAIFAEMDGRGTRH